ncbi:MAG: hypothetical protein JWR80_5825 [Bradyrhizobium sp.]|nr:hypothetical protein [Bradyrhizobium sp.]
MTDEHDEDAATEAFSQLKAEVALLRRAVEGLAAATERAEVPDYAPTLGKMTARLEAVEKQVTAMARSPVLSLTPMRVAAEIQSVGAAAHQAARQDWKRAEGSLDNAVRVLGQVVPRPRETALQRRWLMAVGDGGVVAGIALWVGLSGPIARALPDRWQVAERMAAATLNLDRWNAGMRMMVGAGPQEWAKIVAMSAFEDDNRAALEACRQAAAKSGKAQACKVVVRAP